MGHLTKSFVLNLFLTLLNLSNVLTVNNHLKTVFFAYHFEWGICWSENELIENWTEGCLSQPPLTMTFQSDWPSAVSKLNMDGHTDKQKKTITETHFTKTKGQNSQSQKGQTLKDKHKIFTKTGKLTKTKLKSTQNKKWRK